jgi:hypothetical protein
MYDISILPKDTEYRGVQNTENLGILVKCTQYSVLGYQVLAVSDILSIEYIVLYHV